MNIYKESRPIEVVEQREVEEVVIRMTPDEARMLAILIGTTNDSDRVNKVKDARGNDMSWSHLMSQKIETDLYSLASRFTQFYFELVYKLSNPHIVWETNCRVCGIDLGRATHFVCGNSQCPSMTKVTC